MSSIMRIDSSLYSTITADIEKDISLELDRLKTGQRNKDAENVKVYDQVLRQWIQQTTSNASLISSNNNDINILNTTSLSELAGRAMIRFPSAVPLIMLPFMLRSPEISISDLETLKTKIFTSDILNNTLIDYATFLITFRGKPFLSIEDTLKKLNARISAEGELSNRVRVVVLPEYRVVSTDNMMTEKYAANSIEPVFVALSKDAKPRNVEAPEYAFTLITAIAGFATTFIYATDVNSMNADFMKLALAGDVTAVARVFTILFGVMGLQLMHDLAHYASAAINKVKLGVPILLPSLQIGIFGTVLRFLDYPKSRKELFDVSIAGPLVGLLASLSCALIGLDITAHASLDTIATFPALPMGFLQSSFFIDELVNNFLSPTNQAATALLAVHPLFIIGLAGLLANAYNFLPVGKLDGGRVTMAIAGRQGASSISNIFLLGLAVSLVTSTASPVALFWGIYVTLFLRSPDLPPENDVTPIATQADDEKKDLMWFARLTALGICVLLSALIILPVPIDPNSIADGANAGINSGFNSILQGLPGNSPPLSI